MRRERQVEDRRPAGSVRERPFKPVRVLWLREPVKLTPVSRTHVIGVMSDSPKALIEEWTVTGDA